MDEGKTAPQPRYSDTRSRQPEDLIRAAQRHAERLCELALAQTPDRYHGFIVLLEQRKKVGGPDSHPIWADIRLPHLTVDGRIRMAIDEHEAAGKQIHIETTFVMDDTTAQPLARAIVKSEIRGTAVAHARIFLKGGGANRSNPVENGETSAVGRALGFLGYGCFGAGVTSADDVLRAGRPAAPAEGAGEQDAPEGDGEEKGARGGAHPSRAGRAGQSGVLEARVEPTLIPQAILSALNALFDRQQMPGARRVALMKEYRGREGELLRVLESSEPAAPTPPSGSVPTTVTGNPDADEVPF